MRPSSLVALFCAVFSVPAIAGVGGMPDVSGDSIGDIALRAPGAGNTVTVISGADGSVIREIGFFGDSWTVVDHAVLYDGNQDNTADDPVIAAVAINNINDKIKVQLRYAATGASLGAADGIDANNIEFFNNRWDATGIAFIADVNADGDSTDPAIAVLATNETDGRHKVELRYMASGDRIDKYNFFNADWDVLAVEGLVSVGSDAQIAVLAVNSLNGKAKIEMRTVAEGAYSSVFGFGPTADSRDLAVLPDLDASGDNADPALLVLGRKADGSNTVRTRNPVTGVKVQDVWAINSSFQSRSIGLVPDISGNGIPEVVTYSEGGSDGVLKIRDWSTNGTVATLAVAAPSDLPAVVDLLPGSTQLFEFIEFGEQTIVELVAISFRDGGNLIDVHNDNGSEPYYFEWRSRGARRDPGSWTLNNDVLCITDDENDQECWNMSVVDDEDGNPDTFNLYWAQTGGDLNESAESNIAVPVDADKLLGTYRATFPDIPEDPCNSAVCTLTLNANGSLAWQDEAGADDVGTWRINNDGNLRLTTDGGASFEIAYFEEVSEVEGQYQEIAAITYSNVSDEPAVMYVVDYERIDPNDNAPEIADVLNPGVTMILYEEVDPAIEFGVQAFRSDLSVTLTYSDDATRPFYPEFETWGAVVEQGTWVLNGNEICVTSSELECYDLTLIEVGQDSGVYDVLWDDGGGSETWRIAKPWDPAKLAGTYQVTFPDLEEDVCNSIQCTLTLNANGTTSFEEQGDPNAEAGTWSIDADGNLVVDAGADGFEINYIYSVTENGSGNYQTISTVVYSDFSDEPEIIYTLNYVRLP